METYTFMRTFADSWGLVGMLAFFLIAVAIAFRPGGKSAAESAARIPFDETGPAAANPEEEPHG